MFSGYRTLIGTPGALKFSIPGVIARMPISMDSLALIFIVVAVSDSYALAGALSATASAVMAFATPHWSRVADRIGQSAMLVRVIRHWTFSVYSFSLKRCSDLDMVCHNHSG